MQTTFYLMLNSLDPGKYELIPVVPSFPLFQSPATRETMTPYDLSDSGPAERYIPPSEADFLGRVYFSLQFDPVR